MKAGRMSANSANKTPGDASMEKSQRDLSKTIFVVCAPLSVIRLTLGWVNESVFYPGSSVGSTITFGIVEDTSSNPTSNVSF